VPVLLAPVFGPIIGGLIVDGAAWQWLLVVNRRLPPRRLSWRPSRSRGMLAAPTPTASS
jgi:MFS family permease